MNPHKIIPEPEPEIIMPWEEEESWTQKQRKRAKGDLYGLADLLDQQGVSEDEVCAFLALFGQQIGSGSYENWHVRASKWAKKHEPAQKNLDSM